MNNSKTNCVKTWKWALSDKPCPLPKTLIRAGSAAAHVVAIPLPDMNTMDRRCLCA